MNELTFTLRGSSCALHVQGQASRYHPAHTGARLHVAASTHALSFPSLPSGTVVAIKHSATNGAGRTSSTLSPPMLLDATLPVQAKLESCGAALSAADGSASSFTPDPTTLRVCWAAPGFVDNQSAVAHLEWELARFVSGFGWDSLTGTVRVDNGAATLALKSGSFVIEVAELKSRFGISSLAHTSSYRLGVRAVNRAGGVSAPRTAAAPAGSAMSWASEHGVQIIVDTVGPSCLDASAWLCAPEGEGRGSGGGGTTSDDALDVCPDLSFASHHTGVAGSGFQSSTHSMRVQWAGFEDGFGESGIGSCELKVLELSHPGETPLGERCRFSAVFPPPAGDCKSIADGTPRCDVATPTLLAHPWDFSVDQSVLGERVCVPDANIGASPVSAACSYSHECAIANYSSGLWRGLEPVTTKESTRPTTAPHPRYALHRLSQVYNALHSATSAGCTPHRKTFAVAHNRWSGQAPYTVCAYPRSTSSRLRGRCGSLARVEQAARCLPRRLARALRLL